MTGEMGRPTKIDQVIRHADDGTPVTVAEHVVTALRAGNYMEQAAASAGVHKDTLYDWKKKGARISAEVIAGKRTLPRIGSQDRKLLDFSDAVDRAEGEWEVGSNLVLQQLSRQRPVQETRTTTERDAQGALVSTKTVTVQRTEEADSATIRWRLERKFPTRYGRQVDVTGLIGVGAIPESVREQAEKVLGASVERLVENVEARLAATEPGPEAEPQT